MPTANEDVPLSHDLEQATSGQPHELVSAMVATADEESAGESGESEPEQRGEEVA
jgi:hypothetical protein